MHGDVQEPPLPLQFPCPNCGAGQTAEEYLVGRTLKCYQCGGLFNVPAETPGSSSDMDVTVRELGREFGPSSEVNLGE
jgi:uncharacterized Zn finger protein